MTTRIRQTGLGYRMKACIHVALLALTSAAPAASFPPSHEPIVRCENHWLLKEADDPATRVLAFAYVDAQAGFTINYGGKVSLDANGEMVRDPDGTEKFNLKARVASNYPVACLSDIQAAKLGLKEPDWLKAYKDDRPPGPQAVAWASHYNAMGAYAEAVAKLQAARDIGYTSRLMTFELGFADNGLSQFDKAIEVLTAGVAAYPDDKLMIGELAYSYKSRQDFKKAVELYILALSKYKDGETVSRTDFAYNLAACYHAIGDEASAQKWLTKYQEWRQWER